MSKPSQRLFVKPGLAIPHEELAFTFARSGGPGGQNVNKLNTKAVLRWPVVSSPALSTAVRDRFVARYRRRITTEGDLVLSSQRYRDQARNVDDCLEKLREMLLEVATPPKPRKATRPTRAAVERRLAAKEAHARKKRERGRLPED